MTWYHVIIRDFSVTSDFYIEENSRRLEYFHFNHERTEQPCFCFWVLMTNIIPRAACTMYMSMHVCRIRIPNNSAVHVSMKSIDLSLQSSAECTWITTRRLVHGPVAVLTATVGRAVVRQLEPGITRILGHVAVLTTVKPHASVLYVAWFHRARSCSVDKPSEISPTDNKPTPVLLLGRIYTWLSISF